MINPSVSRNSSTRRWLGIAGWLALLVAVILQWRSISQLRHENELLRAELRAAPPDASAQRAASAEAIDVEQLQKDRLELLRLRNEVRRIREQVSPPTADARPVASPPAPSIAPAVQAPGDEARQLGVAALRGDSSALDNLANLAAALRTMKPEEQAATRSAIQSAFDLLGTEAGRGNTAGLQALWQASRIQNLQGFAVKALGQAAGLGNEEALKPLLDPESYLLLRSSATSALKPAADAGNERAIQALAATAADPKHQALWHLAARGLEAAAAAGNATAIDGLATLAAAQNQSISKEAVLALEAAAAARGDPHAREGAAFSRVVNVLHAAAHGGSGRSMIFRRIVFHRLYTWMAPGPLPSSSWAMATTWPLGVTNPGQVGWPESTSTSTNLKPALSNSRRASG
jgi:hypothetical protein